MPRSLAIPLTTSLTTRTILTPLRVSAPAFLHRFSPRLAPIHHVKARQFWGTTFRPQQQAASREQEHLVHDASNQGQPDGKPAKSIAVTIDGEPKVFDSLFLRDSCSCPQCVDPSTKQKLFQTSDIPDSLEGVGRTVVDKEKGWMVEIVWANDIPGYPPEHRTRHSFEWLQQALNVELELRAGVRSDERVLWDRDIITKNNKWVEYEDYMASDEALFEALTHLNKYGLLFVKGVPDSEKSVEDIAGRIGNLKDTLYGRTWDVKSKPNAENIAYTHQFLGLHMDLL
ncbi:Clavaminate synthase-like protein [Glonium stellatum]|uniref:Clavaminate synthase-like protein n=1 Tax=Glonium stellatum TaxID=574774 RepID=A0A8E2JUA8_9PEZI|nr:Clavaminate synthase-like protein [Glonium stellatum]